MAATATVISSATDMTLRATVRRLILIDMAPRWAKVVATAAAARNGMNMGILSGLVGEEMNKRPGWLVVGAFVAWEW